MILFFAIQVSATCWVICWGYCNGSFYIITTTNLARTCSCYPIRFSCFKCSDIKIVPIEWNCFKIIGMGACRSGEREVFCYCIHAIVNGQIPFFICCKLVKESCCCIIQCLYFLAINCWIAFLRSYSNCWSSLHSASFHFCILTRIAHTTCPCYNYSICLSAHEIFVGQILWIYIDYKVSFSTILIFFLGIRMACSRNNHLWFWYSNFTFCIFIKSILVWITQPTLFTLNIFFITSLCTGCRMCIVMRTISNMLFARNRYIFCK